jgi:hypothetical protein
LNRIQLCAALIAALLTHWKGNYYQNPFHKISNLLADSHNASLG